MWWRILEEEGRLREHGYDGFFHMPKKELVKYDISYWQIFSIRSPQWSLFLSHYCFLRWKALTFTFKLLYFFRNSIISHPLLLTDLFSPLYNDVWTRGLTNRQQFLTPNCSLVNNSVEPAILPKLINLC